MADADAPPAPDDGRETANSGAEVGGSPVSGDGKEAGASRSGSTGATGGDIARKVTEKVRQVSQSMDHAVGTAVGNVKESAGKLKDRVSKPKMVELKGTSGYDLLLDTDGRRSADPETLFTIDRESHGRVKKVTEGLTSSLQVLANEPSLGLYRMEEHVLKAVPELVKTNEEISKLTAIVQGACHDVEYALTTVQQMHQISSFQSLQAHTEKAIEYQHKIRSMEKKAARARQAQNQPEMSPDLIEPTGAFSSSLRTGMTPTDDLSVEDRAGPEGGEMDAHPAAEGDGGETIGAEGDAGATTGGDDTPVTSPRKKKKKKKAKEIVTKSF
eukprot:m.185669 g.185669  ORF g.185669 m.185669 type:complete len:328 (+) comp16521_c0_seq1:70-1053(+)